MSLWIIEKEKMAAFVAGMQGDYRIVGPLAKGTKFAFGEISDPGKLRLDYNTTILPPKKYLQPPEERMMTFRRTGEPVAESTDEIQFRMAGPGTRVFRIK